ncbi:MFS transporter [Patescibacteria group bacterium]|nr:MFS transporter [Patescibacteria group bacterium]
MKSNIWKIYVISFFGGFFFLSSVLVPFFTDWGRLTLSQTLSLQSWFMICCFVFEFPSGGFADRYGKKLSLALAFILESLGFVIYASMPNFWVFILAETILAIGCSLISGTKSSFISCTLKNQNQSHLLKEVLGKNESISMIGMLLGSFLGGLIAYYIGLRETVLYTAISPAIAFGISLTLVEPKNGEAKESYWKILKEGFLCFKNSKALSILALDKIIVQILCFFLIWIYQPFLKQEGILIVYFGMIHSLICLSQIAVLSNFSKLERICGSGKNYLFMSSIIPGIFLILIGISFGNIFFKIFGILVISGLGLSRGTLSTNYMLGHIKGSYQTTALSFAEMFRKIITAILYPLIGLLMDWSINNTFLILGVTLVIFSLVPTIKDEYLK